MEGVDKCNEILGWMEDNMTDSPFAELLNFPDGFQTIVDLVLETYYEAPDASSSDCAQEILEELYKLAEKEALLENDSDKEFFVAVTDIAATSTKFPKELHTEFCRILAQDVSLEAAIEKCNRFSLQVLDLFDTADVCGGRYNERIKLLVNG